MLRILSSFDDRFSRFTLSPPANGSDQQERNAPPLPASANSVVEVEEKSLQESLDLIQQWKRPSESSCRTFIWPDKPDLSKSYLNAVDFLQEFVKNPSPAVDSSTLDSAQNALQIAMLRLEDELQNLMETYGKPIDPDSLKETTGDNGDEEGDTNGGDKDGLMESNAERGRVDKNVKSMSIELFPCEIVTILGNIATRMVSNGYQAQCRRVYVCNRKGALEENLQRLGFEKLSVQDVQTMPWELMENEIINWIYIIELAVRVLLRNEKELCKSVFGDRLILIEDIFAEFAGGSITQLLNFGEAIASAETSPEKLFKLLDMYEALSESLSVIDDLFARGSGVDIRAEATAILSRIGDAAKRTFSAFENAVQRETSRNPVPGGAVHPLTRYVMNYIRFFSEYTETLDYLLKDRDDAQSRDQKSRSEGSCKGPLSLLTLNILELLEKNLDTKSRLYKDPSLKLLFLMNNLHYMVQKSRIAEVRKLIGDDWIKKHSGKLLFYHTDYRRTAWTKVLSYLVDEGISVSSGSMNAATRNLIKERFKNFNTAFEEIVKTQSSWIVSDSQLCAELQISITGMILPAYRNFLARFQKHLDAVKYRERYVKYTPEEVEDYINSLFSGSSGSMNRRKG
ncbi:hypothetical protein KP509_20G052000 [Ceratopteris richardii]|nr:hypothetical protein KP509_20G052000 [Ceratopteris richardii]